MTELEWEVKQVLVGRTILLDDGRLATMGPEDYRMPTGVMDGATEVRLFGLAKKQVVLECDMDQESALQAVGDVLKNLGRGLVLIYHPEMAACLFRYILTRPAVLTVGYEEDKLILTAWTGRSLNAWAALRRAITSFERHLPEGIRFTREAPPVAAEEEKPAKKASKKKKTVKKTAEEIDQ